LIHGSDYEGHDLRKVPLRDRRAVLKTLFDSRGTEHLRFSEDFEPDAQSVLCQADHRG